MSRRNLWTGVICAGVIGSLASTGCEPASAPAPTTPPSTASQPVAPSAANATGVALETNAPGQNGAAESSAAAPAAGEAPVLARPGVAKQGQSLRNETGVGRMIAQPAITLFTVRERAIFEVQIPHAINLWEATNGRKPKSHEEFMNEIIKANNLKLPELPAGKVYQYHPDDGQLYVHSANQ